MDYGYLVTLDDRCCYTFLCGDDPDCEGGLTPANKTARIFATRAEARHAIKISQANARLRLLRGECEDGEDWTKGSLLKPLIVKAVLPAPYNQEPHDESK